MTFVAARSCTVYNDDQFRRYAESYSQACTRVRSCNEYAARNGAGRAVRGRGCFRPLFQLRGSIGGYRAHCRSGAEQPSLARSSRGMLRRLADARLLVYANQACVKLSRSKDRDRAVVFCGCAPDKFSFAQTAVAGFASRNERDLCQKLRSSLPTRGRASIFLLLVPCANSTIGLQQFEVAA